MLMLPTQCRWAVLSSWNAGGAKTVWWGTGKNVVCIPTIKRQGGWGESSGTGPRTFNVSHRTGLWGWPAYWSWKYKKTQQTEKKLQTMHIINVGSTKKIGSVLGWCQANGKGWHLKCHFSSWAWSQFWYAQSFPVFVNLLWLWWTAVIFHGF